MMGQLKYASIQGRKLKDFFSLNNSYASIVSADEILTETYNRNDKVT